MERARRVTTATLTAAAAGKKRGRRNVDMTAVDKCRRISSAAATCRDRPPEGEEEERWRDENKRQQSESVKAAIRLMGPTGDKKQTTASEFWGLKEQHISDKVTKQNT